MNIRSANLASTIPFDTKKLDDLLEQAGIDIMIVTSKHNVEYLKSNKLRKNNETNVSR